VWRLLAKGGDLSVITCHINPHPIPIGLQARMPVCRNFLKTGECKDIGCLFKHDEDEIRECNMYKLGFCIYGPTCRYKHKKVPGAWVY